MIKRIIEYIKNRALRNYYYDLMIHFFKDVMIKLMIENHKEKGDSWKNLNYSYLIDNLFKQFDDMLLDPDRENYFGNVANYCFMLWYKEKEDMKND